MVYDLSILSTMLDDAPMKELAMASARYYDFYLSKVPDALSFYMMGLRMLLKPGQELVIAGDPSDNGTKKMIGAVNTFYLPYTVLMLNPIRKGKQPECKNLSGLKDKVLLDGKATAYLCQNAVCQKPTNGVEELEDMLRSGRRSA
jgi:uncharacterized protein